MRGAARCRNDPAVLLIKSSRSLTARLTSQLYAPAASASRATAQTRAREALRSITAPPTPALSISKHALDPVAITASQPPPAAGAEECRGSSINWLAWTASVDTGSVSQQTAALDVPKAPDTNRAPTSSARILAAIVASSEDMTSRVVSAVIMAMKDRRLPTRAMATTRSKRGARPQPRNCSKKVRRRRPMSTPQQQLQDGREARLGRRVGPSARREHNVVGLSLVSLSAAKELPSPPRVQPPPPNSYRLTPPKGTVRPPATGTDGKVGTSQVIDLLRASHLPPQRTPTHPPRTAVRMRGAHAEVVDGCIEHDAAPRWREKKMNVRKTRLERGAPVTRAPVATRRKPPVSVRSGSTGGRHRDPSRSKMGCEASHLCRRRWREVRNAKRRPAARPS